MEYVLSNEERNAVYKALSHPDTDNGTHYLSVALSDDVEVEVIYKADTPAWYSPGNFYEPPDIHYGETTLEVADMVINVWDTEGEVSTIPLDGEFIAECERRMQDAIRL